MAWKYCQTCHGNGEIQKESPPGKWQTVKCPAGCLKGVVNTGTI